MLVVLQKNYLQTDALKVCPGVLSYIALSLKRFCSCVDEVPFQALYDLHSVC